MEDGSEAGCDLPPGQPCELTITSNETNGQSEQSEVSRVQEQITIGEILGLNNAGFEARNEVENLSSYDLLKLMWENNAGG
jgi:hypothetical protein